MVLGGEIRAVDLARELEIKDSTLRRWAQEHGKIGENAFPGNGSPEVNKDHEIVKLRKRIEEPEHVNLVDRAFDVERPVHEAHARVAHLDRLRAFILSARPITV